MGSSRIGHGQHAVDDHLLAGAREFRSHLELLYPFGAVAVLSLLLEVRLETLELLFDVEGFRLVVDADALDALFPAPLAEQVAPVLSELLWLFVLGLVLLLLLTSLVALFAVGIAFLVVADTSRGNERGQFGRARVALARLPALAAATFLAGLAVTAGLALFVLPGLYLAVKFALAGPAIVVDGDGPLAGLRRSWASTAGQFVDVGGVLALGGTAFVLVALIPFVGELLAVLVIFPILALTVAVLYLETEGPASQPA